MASLSLTKCSFAHFLITGAMKGYNEERDREEQDYNTCSDKGDPASALLLATLPTITFASISG